MVSINVSIKNVQMSTINMNTLVWMNVMNITLRKTKNDANAPNPTRVPLLGLQEHLLTAGDKADWLSYYKDLEHRVKLTGRSSANDNR